MREPRNWHSARAALWGTVARLKSYPSARRLRALIQVLGFEGWGAQTRFAKEIGVDRRRLNNVLVGYPLSGKLAQKIIRCYPSVSTDFLFLGRSGGNLESKTRAAVIGLSKENWDFCLYFLVALGE